LRLAQELGAQTAVLAAPDLVDAALDYARAHNLGKILIGRRPRPRGFWWGRFMRRLGERAPDVDLIAVARGAPPPRSASQAPEAAAVIGLADWQRYGGAAMLCLAVTVLATPLRGWFELTNIVMLFLLAVVGAAFRWGRGPAVLAALLSVALFDFFFVPPRLTFAVSDVQYLLTFGVMLIVGLTIGQLMARLRYQARIAYHREERIRSLYELAKVLAAALSEAQVMEISARFLQAAFRARAWVLLPDAEGRLAADSLPPEADGAIAQWCFDNGQPAGLGTDTLPAAAAAYLPLTAPAGVRGVLVVQPGSRRLLHIPEQRRLLETYATLIAMALERLHLVSQAHDTRLSAESERLRSTLLAALSHDLRTPLTALVGLADTLTLRLLAAQAPESETAAAIRDQALRTSHLVDNLLEMARLQAGNVKPRRDWLALEEIVGAAARSLEPALADHPLHIELPTDLPLVQGDAVMLERVLVNLLDNAIKYTPPGTPIGITAAVADHALEVAVWDQGPGLPPGQEQAIFERFARGERESAIAGMGLGLAICQAIVSAHGGRIHAENRPGGGARFVFTLPLAPAPVQPEDAAEERPSKAPS
jgi:two-component system sensor histidine kinase KdpD